ncbi:hypothetical protein QBC46DRAFT_19974 [Diplogelasinospora grovesii]|uniref:Uncharacterized protein n=1 Tax=Diplogelasinospora grovesii TaxID=303347 RepID=A0AAN6S1F2_9PEZI|nr:hypothetical protein QBC46DRAFT_19974 [Diplogelasinospora grovesii]
MTRPYLSRVHGTTGSLNSQSENWSCSIHAIANAMAFLRLEVMGWDRIDYSRRGPSRMRDKLINCLHKLMGLSNGHFRDAQFHKRLPTLGRPTADSSRF